MREQTKKILRELIALDTSRGQNQRETIALLKKIFYKATQSVVLETNQVSAIIFGMNCELHDIEQVVLFAGHIDTVPWSHNQGISMNEEYLYGRGSCDMKSFFPCLAEAVDKYLDSNITIPIIIAVSFDEETGSSGAKEICSFFKNNLIDVQYCIVGEPTSLNIALENRGCYDIMLDIYSEDAHISECMENPIEIGAKFIDEIKRTHSSEETRIDFGIIQGGASLNVVPDICRIGFSVRTMNPEFIAKIYEDVKRIVQRNYNITVCDSSLIPFSNMDSSLAKILLQLKDTNTIMYSASTEAGYYMELGADTIVFGPGNISLAHSPKEHILLAELEEYINLINELLSVL